LSENPEFQDAMEQDSNMLAEIIASSVARAGAEAIQEQGIGLPDPIIQYAENQVLATLQTSFGRFLRGSFYKAISAVLDERLGNTFRYYVQDSQFAPEINGVNRLVSDIFSPQVPAPQSNNGLVSKFIGGSIPLIGAFMGIAVGSMIKSLNVTEAFSGKNILQSNHNNWYKRHIESAEKNLYVAYLIQPGQPAEIIEDSYVQAHSAKQARKLVLNRRDAVAQRIKRYESYDEYGIVVYWVKVPKKEEKQDKVEDPANNLENEVGEALTQTPKPQQMDFFTELGV
jgi:hypothetical protein